MKPEDAEIARLKRELAKTRAERGHGKLLLDPQDRANSPDERQTRDEARADVFAYIEQFYNLRRRHSTLDYVSSADFEKAAGLC